MKVFVLLAILILLLIYGSVRYLECGDDMRNGGFYETCTLRPILK